MRLPNQGVTLSEVVVLHWGWPWRGQLLDIICWLHPCSWAANPSQRGLGVTISRLSMQGKCLHWSMCPFLLPFFCSKFPAHHMLPILPQNLVSSCLEGWEKYSPAKAADGTAYSIEVFLWGRKDGSHQAPVSKSMCSLTHLLRNYESFYCAQQWKTQSISHNMRIWGLYFLVPLETL